MLVPVPERYAVHKLIVATRRHQDGIGLEKIHKDRQQAYAIFEAMFDANEHATVAEAYLEAIKRGATWNEAIVKSLMAYCQDAIS